MRSIAKLLRILVYCAAECITFFLCFVAVDFAFKGRWSMTVGLSILWFMLRAEVEKLREWAEKF
jgi:hypothetical protein